MQNETSIDQRLARLEQAVEDLRRQIMLLPRSGNWLEKITGSISEENEEAFLEALEAGRAYRHADRPPDEPGDQP